MMMLRKLLLPSILICIFVFSPVFSAGQNLDALASQNQAISAQAGSFTATPCMFKLPAGITEGTDIQCGYLTVPSNHDQPEGQTIRLAVAIIKSLEAQPKVDPLFIAQGGPGGSTIDTYVTPLFSATSRIRTNRDLVLFDQRGTLYSQPSLYCTEYDQFVMDNLESDLSPEEYNRLFQEAMQKCRQRLVSQGINLSDFNSIENAHDIESLRLALGYEKINLYGVSYGTLLALHYMRLYPDSLRSVVLDGVVAPQLNTVLDNAANQDHAFRHFFDSCAADPDCNRDYPNLETVFYDLVAKFEETPARITLTDPEDNISFNAILDGEGFMGSVFQILYASSLIPALPKMIYAADKGDFTVLSSILSIFIFDRSMSYGMYFSAWCAEDADFNPQTVDLSKINPVLAEFEKNSPQEFLDTCNNWQVQPLGPEADAPVVSDVPTLLLSGAYDPVTPAANAKVVAAGLSNSFSVTFPLGAHGQMLDNKCSDGILLAFLDDPQNAPDTSCIADYTQPKFFTSKTVITLPAILKILGLKGSSGLEAGMLALALLFLSTALFFLPLAWLVNLLRPKPRTASPTLGQSPFSSEFPGYQNAAPSAFETALENETQPSLMMRFSSWAAALNATILLTFCIAVVAIIIQMITANDSRLYFGIAGEYRAWFVLPPIALLLTIAMLGASFKGWRWKAWSIWRRFYYTLLTLAALVCVGVLGVWGMLIAFFS